jgi:hypothetical protein
MFKRVKNFGPLYGQFAHDPRTRYTQRELQAVSAHQAAHKTSIIGSELWFLVALLNTNSSTTTLILPRNVDIAAVHHDLLSGQPNDHFTAIFDMLSVHTVARLSAVSRHLHRRVLGYTACNQNKFLRAEYRVYNKLASHHTNMHDDPSYLHKMLCVKYPRYDFAHVFYDGLRLDQLVELDINYNELTHRVELPMLIKLKCWCNALPFVVAPQVTDITLHDGSSRDSRVDWLRYVLNWRLKKLDTFMDLSQLELDALASIRTLEFMKISLGRDGGTFVRRATEEECIAADIAYHNRANFDEHNYRILRMEKCFVCPSDEYVHQDSNEIYMYRKRIRLPRIPININVTDGTWVELNEYVVELSHMSDSIDLRLAPNLKYLECSSSPNTVSNVPDTLRLPGVPRTHIYRNVHVMRSLKNTSVTLLHSFDTIDQLIGIHSLTISKPVSSEQLQTLLCSSVRVLRVRAPPHEVNDDQVLNSEIQHLVIDHQSIRNDIIQYSELP